MGNLHNGWQKSLNYHQHLFHSRQRTTTSPSVTLLDMIIEKSVYTFVSVSVCMCKDSIEGSLHLSFTKVTIFQIKQCRVQNLILACRKGTELCWQLSLKQPERPGWNQWNWKRGTIQIEWSGLVVKLWQDRGHRALDGNPHNSSGAGEAASGASTWRKCLCWCTPSTPGTTIATRVCPQA